MSPKTGPTSALLWLYPFTSTCMALQTSCLPRCSWARCPLDQPTHLRPASHCGASREATHHDASSVTSPGVVIQCSPHFLHPAVSGCWYWCWWLLLLRVASQGLVLVALQGNMGSATACQYRHWPGGIANRVEQSVLAVTGREHHYHAPPMQNGSGCAPCMLWWGSLQALNAPPPSSNTTALVLLQYLTNVKRKVRFAALKAAPEVVQFQFWIMHSANFH